MLSSEFWVLTQNFTVSLSDQLRTQNPEPSLPIPNSAFQIPHSESLLAFQLSTQNSQLRTLRGVAMGEGQSITIRVCWRTIRSRKEMSANWVDGKAEVEVKVERRSVFLHVSLSLSLNLPILLADFVNSLLVDSNGMGGQSFCVETCRTGMQRVKYVARAVLMAVRYEGGKGVCGIGG